MSPIPKEDDLIWMRKEVARMHRLYEAIRPTEPTEVSVKFICEMVEAEGRLEELEDAALLHVD